MNDDKTRQDGGELPKADPVADDGMVDELKNQSDENSSEDGTEDANLEDDADKGEPGRVGKKTSKAVAHKIARVLVEKTTATRRCSKTEREKHDPYRAKDPARFAYQFTTELKRVVWLSWRELTALFSAVLLFALFIVVYVMFFDNDFGWTLLGLFGGNPR